MSQKTCWMGGATGGTVAGNASKGAPGLWPAWAILRFKGFGVIACEPNANAPCDWKLRVQL